MAGETGLVDIKRLVLSDTFNTWFDTTNQIIDAIDPITVYGVQALTGVNLVSGASGGNYNGIKYIGLLPNQGVGYYGNNVSLDYSNLSSGAGSPIVATGDYYAFFDISDTTQTPYGTIKRVLASDMLPASINAPGGNINLEGNLTINGQLFVGGGNSFLASNDLRIEDKNVIIAYQLAGFLGATGISSGSYPAIGSTAYYYDPGITNFIASTATVIGIVKSISGPAFGPTAEIKLGSVFTKGGPELFTLGGVVRFSGTGASGGAYGYGASGPFGGPTGISFGIVSVYGDASSQFTVQGPTTEYFDDGQLSGAGFTIKGASGDKLFVWSPSQQSLISNVGLGVASDQQFINARYFRNLGLTSDNKNDFVFLGSSSNSQNTSVAISYDGRGKWAFEYEDATAGAETLLVRYATGPAANTYTVAQINGLTSGPFGITSTAGGSANMWAQGFNAQFVNGAGASFGSSPYSIPIADERGRINDRWLEASSIRTKITQTNHGLTTGNTVAFVSGSYTGANASTFTDPRSECVGIVETVPDANNFVLLSQGYVANIPNINAGINKIYFLSTSSGGLTSTDPSTANGWAQNSVRKPVFYPTLSSGGSAAGYVLSYPGQVIAAGQTATDQVYMEGLIPVGSIQQYAGSTETPTYNQQNWIPCDGRAVSYQQYIDLYTSIGNVFYARGIASTITAPNPIIVVERDTRLLDAGDLVKLVVDTGTSGGGTAWNASVVSVNTTNSTITLTGDTVGWATAGAGITAGSYVRIYGLIDVARGPSSTFFVPDMRTRTSVGSVTGESQFWLGDTWFPSSSWSIEGYTPGFGVGPTGGATGGGFVATNYLIRSSKTTPALILSGHNHDDRYLFKTQADAHTGAAGITFSGNGTYFFGRDYSSPVLAINNSSRLVTLGTTASHGSFLSVYGSVSLSGASGNGQGLFVNLNGTDANTLSNSLVQMTSRSPMEIKMAGTTNIGLFFGGVGTIGATASSGIQSADSTGVTAGNISMQPFGGNVGIGTTAPDNTLTVVGGLKVANSANNITGAFFTQPLFNTTVTDGNITLSPPGPITLQASLFQAYGTVVDSVYSIDPGGGISILTGNTVKINSGFIWKII